MKHVVDRLLCEAEPVPPAPPVRARPPPRLTVAAKFLIGSWLALWVAFTVALYFNQLISFDEARELAERYRVGLQDVYVRTNVVLGADGTVLHEGKSILSIHHLPLEGNVTTHG